MVSDVSHRPHGLAVLIFAALLVPGSGCASLLGISEPEPRRTSSAAAAAGASDGGASDGGASDGGVPSITIVSGGGDQAGEPPVGDAGSSFEPCAKLGALRCGGEASKAPQICDGQVWRAHTLENDGQDCPDLCVDGECVECVNTKIRCVGAQSQQCVNGAWKPKDCDNYCLDGACQNPRSCDKLGDLRCGSDQASCCQALEVPGGTFARSYDGAEYSSNAYSAKVSSFLLDRFEVSVGRFVEFVAKYDALALVDGQGKSPHINGDLGWQSAYRALMPPDAVALDAELKCHNATWLNRDVGGLNLPINCLSFYVAYAFCVWDQGRLPTEAEWNYAAAGGDEQRVYPWTTGPNQGPNTSYAYYGQVIGTPIDIGSTPKGNGRWGHSDLAGNVGEWVLDYLAEQYPSTECDDCVNTTFQAFRVMRGGGYELGADAQKASFRTGLQPDGVKPVSGLRCARDLPTLTPN